MSQLQNKYLVGFIFQYNICGAQIQRFRENCLICFMLVVLLFFLSHEGHEKNYYSTIVIFQISIKSKPVTLFCVYL